MRRKKKILEPPWQVRFLAGLAPQLNLRIDREIALCLQELSSFPKDSTAEVLLAKFLKGEIDFPEKWAEIIITKCEKGFTERWIDKLSSTQESTQEISPKRNNSKPEPTQLQKKPKESVVKNSEPRPELPQVIINGLMQALSYSLSEDKQIFIKRFMQKLNGTLPNYSVSRKGHTISFKGKRVLHQFDIPEDVEFIQR